MEYRVELNGILVRISNTLHLLCGKNLPTHDSSSLSTSLSSALSSHIQSNNTHTTMSRLESIESTKSLTSVRSIDPTGGTSFIFINLLPPIGCFPIRRPRRFCCPHHFHRRCCATLLLTSSPPPSSYPASDSIGLSPCCPQSQKRSNSRNQITIS